MRLSLTGLGTPMATATSGLYMSVANSIMRMEGTNPNLASNNNPGNLVYAGQAGAVPGTNGFAQFPTLDAGVQALQNQIALDAGRGETLSQFLNKYAPPSENSTSNYIDFVSSQTGLSPDDPLSLAAGSMPTGTDDSASAATADTASAGFLDSTVSVAGISLSVPLLMFAGIGLLAVFWLARR